MGNLFLAIFILLAILLQTTFFDYIKILGVKPDLILVIAVIYALHNKEKRGGVFGLSVGLVQDIIIGSYIGMNGLTKGVTSYIVCHMEQKIYKENIIIPIFTVFGASVFHDTLIFILMSLFNIKASLSTAFLGIILPTAIYNCLLVPVIYPGLHKALTKGILSHYN